MNRYLYATVMPMTSKDKITSRADAAKLSEAKRAAGKVVGFTSGVFDLLHPGHVQYLEEARSRCDFLIVGINSDVSVRGLKGALRPICPENDRAAVIAGLASVDHVFIFGEKNNNQNVIDISPSIYFKAGDYQLDTLSSKPLVEERGGRVELVSFLGGRSSTDIIDRISQLTNPVMAPEMVQPAPLPKPAVFLDRDGTINFLRDYLSESSKFELIPGVIEGLKKLQAAGYRLIITTNQPGVGLGYFSREDVYRVHSYFLSLVFKEGIMIDKIYFCPHNESERCSCRKPATGMIDRAVSELNIDRSKSVVIGDMTTDVLFGRNAHCQTVLVKTGKGGSDNKYDLTPDFTAEDLNDAADWIVARE